MYLIHLKQVSIEATLLRLEQQNESLRLKHIDIKARLDTLDAYRKSLGFYENFAEEKLLAILKYEDQLIDQLSLTDMFDDKSMESQEHINWDLLEAAEPSEPEDYGTMKHPINLN